jgi:superfamily I DNA/RNA helicase
MPGDPIKLITECAASLSQFKNKMFYILIDEYENFTNYQQQSLNSLLKQYQSITTTAKN